MSNQNFNIQPPQFNPNPTPQPIHTPPQQFYYAPPTQPNPAPQPIRNIPNPNEVLPKRIAAIEVTNNLTTFKFALIGSIIGMLIAPALYIFNMGVGIGATLLFMAGFMFLLFKVNSHIKYLTNMYYLDPREIRPAL